MKAENVNNYIKMVDEDLYGYFGRRGIPSLICEVLNDVTER